MYRLRNCQISDSRGLLHAKKVIHRDASWAYRIGLANRLGHVSLGQHHRITKLAAECQVGSNSRSKGAACAMGMFDLYPVGPKDLEVCTVKIDVHGLFEVSPCYHHGLGAVLNQLACGSPHALQI